MTMFVVALSLVVQSAVPSTTQAPTFQAVASTELLLKAKTVAILGKTGKQMMDRAWANPNGERGKEKIATALNQWGRYQIVDDPLAAELILVVFETQKNLNLMKRANLVAELKVYPGGAALTDETPVLWSGEAAEGFRKMPSTRVAEKFRDYVLSLENPVSREN
jgi:hypothetical protein